MRTSPPTRGCRRDELATNGTRFAALVDIENMVIVGGRRLPAHEGQPLLHEVQTCVEGMQVRVATGENVLREYVHTLGQLPWGRTFVSTEPDAADRALLAAGHGFIDSGVTDLIVVSGDHAFVELAARARLHVVAHRSHLSRTLRLAAASVRYLPTQPLHVRAAG